MDTETRTTITDEMIAEFTVTTAELIKKDTGSNRYIVFGSPDNCGANPRTISTFYDVDADYGQLAFAKFYIANCSDNVEIIKDALNICYNGSDDYDPVEDCNDKLAVALWAWELIALDFYVNKSGIDMWGEFESFVFQPKKL